MKYRVELSKRAIKELKALDANAGADVLTAIRTLELDPRPASGVKRLKGYEGQALRLRAGD